MNIQPFEMSAEAFQAQSVVVPVQKQRQGRGVKLVIPPQHLRREDQLRRAIHADVGDPSQAEALMSRLLTMDMQDDLFYSQLYGRSGGHMLILVDAKLHQIAGDLEVMCIVHRHELEQAMRTGEQVSMDLLSAYRARPPVELPEELYN